MVISARSFRPGHFVQSFRPAEVTFLGRNDLSHFVSSYKNFEKNLKSSTFFIWAEMVNDLAEIDITLAEKDMHFGRNGHF